MDADVSNALRENASPPGGLGKLPFSIVTQVSQNFAKIGEINP
jgi:hypothetical protein